jgi:hypothetical protein
MKYVATFALIALLVAGCAITDYPTQQRDQSFANCWADAIIESTDSWINTGGGSRVGNGIAWTEGFTFIDQDIEGNQLLNGYFTSIPYEEPQGWVVNGDFCDSFLNPFEKQATGNVGGGVNGKRFCHGLTAPNPVVGDTDVFDYVFVATVNQCPGLSGLSVLVSYGGAVQLCGGRKKGETPVMKGDTYGLTPFEQVEILNELNTHATLDGNNYNYVVDGKDLKIQGTIAGFDKTYALDLSGVTIPLQVTKELNGWSLDLPSITNIDSILNQIADIADELAGHGLNVKVSWKGISKTYHIGLLNGDHYRDMARGLNTPATMAPSK